MSKQILLVIDVQNDFINGSLGTPEAQQMLPALIEKIRNFDGETILTQDTHSEDYLKTQEGKLLPVPHCIKGTQGWNFPETLEHLRREQNFPVYQKNTFGSILLARDLQKRYEAGNLVSVELTGLCTDICVISNALLLKAFMPELPVYVDASCCAGVTIEKHMAALDTMKSCQILVKEA